MSKSQTSTDDSTGQLTAELEQAELCGVADHHGRVVTAHIAVYRGDEKIGAFGARYEEGNHREESFDADWSTGTDYATGIYATVREEPPFWPVEAVVAALEAMYPDESFRAINSGPNDR
jgi:hypothetical protein